MSASGGGKVNLTRDTGTEDAEPTWSPDGAILLFTREGTNIMALPGTGGAASAVVAGTDTTWGAQSRAASRSEARKETWAATVAGSPRPSSARPAMAEHEISVAGFLDLEIAQVSKFTQASFSSGRPPTHWCQGPGRRST